MKESGFLIAVEGNIDNVLIYEIIDKICFSSKNKIKQDEIYVQICGGNSKVIKNIINFRGSCIGIIDNDKEKPKDYDKFEEICVDKEFLQIKFINNSFQNHYKYLFINNPPAERWLDNCVKELGKDRTHFGLPDDFRKYVHLAKKSQLSNELITFIKFIVKSNAIPVKTFYHVFRKIIKFHLSIS